METKELTRRELLKKFGMAGAVLAAMPAAKAVGMEGEQETSPEWSKDDFYKQVAFMFQKAADLQKKTYGRFNPNRHIFFVEVRPSMEEEMKKTYCKYGMNTWDFLHDVWPKSLWATVGGTLPASMTFHRISEGKTFEVAI